MEKVSLTQRVIHVSKFNWIAPHTPNLKKEIGKGNRFPPFSIVSTKINMAIVASVSFVSIAQSADRKFSIPPSNRCLVSNFSALKLLFPGGSCKLRSGSLRSGVVVQCMSPTAGKRHCLSLGFSSVLFSLISE